MSSGLLRFEAAYPQYQADILPLEDEDTEIGIEIEVEKVRRIPEGYELWQVKHDNSLRNSGYEFVTHPVRGKRIHYALNWFFSNLNSDHHFSPRTSVHVHVNVLALTPKQIAGMALVYAPFEKLLYRFVGGDRDKNNFCVPIADVGGAGNIIDVLTMDAYVPQPLDSHRYLGLNFDAVRKFGTLEFRHLGGTADMRKIITWINLILKIRQFAVNNSLETIHEIINRLNTDSSYMAFLSQVFGRQSTYLDTRTLQKDMEKNVSYCKRIVMNNDAFWEEIRAKSGKDCHWIRKIEKRTELPRFVEFARVVQPRRGGGRVAQPRLRGEALRAPFNPGLLAAAPAPLRDYNDEGDE